LTPTPRSPPPEWDTPLPEEFALARDASLFKAEADRRASRFKLVRPAINVSTLLLLGLRRIRYELALRIDAWQALWEIMMAPPAPPPCPPLPSDPLPHAPPVGPPTAPGTPLHMVLNSLELWANQPPGRATVRELRWQGAPSLVVIKRLRAEASFPLNTTIALVAKAFPSLGIPRVTDGAFSWSNRFTAWGEARALAHTT